MSYQDQSGVGSSEVKQFVDLLHYQEGSIVSRVLLKNKGATVTLFAFDVGEGRSEHTAPFDALVVVTDGVADIEIASESFRVQGETIILPANKPCCESSYEIQNAAHHDPGITRPGNGS